MESQNTQKSSGSKFWMILSFLLMAVVAFLSYSLYQEMQKLQSSETQVVELGDEKAQITAELEDMLAQYEELSVTSSDMEGKIEEQKEKIEKLLKEAKDKNWTIHKLKKETETLRNIMKGYLVTIDSLNTANQTLIAEKSKMSKELGKERQAKSELIKEKGSLEEKVKIGAKLEALDLSANAQKVRSNNLHRDTDRAKYSEKIKTCFTLNKNELTKAGKKEIFIRIITPNGEVLADAQDESKMFEYDGIKGLYTLKREIIYDNTELDLCYYWDVVGSLAAGKYIVEVYAENYSIGSTSFTLK